jgi:hypothetical protein
MSVRSRPDRNPHETCWATFLGPPDVVQLFEAVLSSVRRRLERDTGHLPTEGEALGAMLEHCFEAWGARDAGMLPEGGHAGGDRPGVRTASSSVPLPLP